MHTITVTVVTNCMEKEGGCVNPTTNGLEPRPHVLYEGLTESSVKVWSIAKFYREISYCILYYLVVSFKYYNYYSWSE